MSSDPASPEPTAFAWNFAGATFDEGRWELVVQGEVQALERKPLEVLGFLLRHADEVVTKDELLEAVWAGRVVVEGALTNAIGKLRKALGDDAQAVIVTVPKVGYRLTARVERKVVKRLAPASQLQAGDAVPRRPNWKLDTRLDAASDTEVWLARHAKTGESRVFKFSLDGSRLAGLKREATVSRLLKAGLGERDDLVRVIDWDFEDAPYFLECEYGGQDLLAWADSRGGLESVPLAERLDWMRQICDTVDAAHGLGVLHKDLKPSNVLMSERNGRWQPRVADFGSSRLADTTQLEQYGITNLGFSRTLDQTSSDSGTPYYIAPEVLSGAMATARSDLFALGVLLYQMVVGDLRKPLFPGWEQGIDDEVLREDIAQAAHGDPESRLGSARELSQRLASLAERRQTRSAMATLHAKEAALQAQLDRTRTLRPWVVATAAAMFVGLLVSLYFLMQARQAESATQQQLAVAESILDFLVTDLLPQADPERAGKEGLTVQEAIDRSLDSMGSRFADKPLVEGRIRHAIGLVYASVSEIEKSLEQLERSKTLLTPLLGTLDGRVLDAYYSRVESFAFLGRYKEAEAELAQVDAILATTDTIDPARRVQHLATKSIVDGSMNRQSDAIEAVDEAIRIAADTPDVPEDKRHRLLERQVQYYTMAGRYAEAIPMYEAIIARLENQHGPKASRTLQALIVYAQLLFATGNNDKGFEVAHRLLRDLPETVGKDDPTIGSVHGVLAEGYMRTNRPNESADAYRQAHAIYSNGLGPASPYTLQMSQGEGEALRFAKRAAEAVGVLRGTLVRAKEGLPEDSPLIGTIAWDYAYAALDEDDVTTASSLLPDFDTDLLRNNQDGIDWPGRIALVKGRLALARQEKSVAIAELTLAESRLVKADNDPAFLEDARRFMAAANALK
jgi:serine/threonine protein kinase/DNA-binding winged helix-turn-helix (wHTH) protein